MFAQILLQAISGVVSAELIALLEKFKELNGEEKYNQLREAIRNSFLLLQTVTDKTKTKVDDTAVAMILNAVN
jgi:hypothetical protein